MAGPVTDTLRPLRPFPTAGPTIGGFTFPPGRIGRLRGGPRDPRSCHEDRTARTCGACGAHWEAMFDRPVERIYMPYLSSHSEHAT